MREKARKRVSQDEQDPLAQGSATRGSGADAAL